MRLTFLPVFYSDEKKFVRSFGKKDFCSGGEARKKSNNSSALTRIFWPEPATLTQDQVNQL